MTPSRIWKQVYEQVAKEMGMPPRGLAGSAQNKRRQELAPKIFRETQIRAGKERPY